MGCSTSPRVQCAATYNTRSLGVLAMSVRPQQCGCVSAMFISVLLIALSSAVLARVDVDESGYRLCIGPGCADGIGPSYKVGGARVRRAIDDNDISKDSNSVHWKPADLDIMFEKLRVYQDSNGNYKATKDVIVESDNGDGALESAITVDLKSEGTDNVDNEQKIFYSYPYVVFRRIGDEKKIAGKEHPIVKDGNSYILYGDYKEHTEPLEGRKSPNDNAHSANDKTKSEEVIRNILHNFFKSITRGRNEESTTDKRVEVNDASNVIKAALTVAKKLLNNLNEMDKKVDSSPSETTNSGTFLNGMYRDYRSPVGGNWKPWEWKSTSESSGDVTKVDAVKGGVGRKLSRPSSVSSGCPFAQRGHLSGGHNFSGLTYPELLWLIAMT